MNFSWKRKIPFCTSCCRTSVSSNMTKHTYKIHFGRGDTQYLAENLPAANLRADLNSVLFHHKGFPPLLTAGKSQCTKANFDFEAIKLFPRPKCMLKNPAWLSNQTRTELQSWFCKAAQSPSDCQKERDESNRIFLLCLLQFMKHLLILTKRKSHSSKCNKGISPVRIKLQKLCHTSVERTSCFFLGIPKRVVCSIIPSIYCCKRE